MGGSTNLGAGGFWTSQKFRFPTIIIFVIFWTGGKNSLDYLEKKYGNIGWCFCSSIAIFLVFYWKFANNQYHLEHLFSSSLWCFLSAASWSLHNEAAMIHHCNHLIVRPFWKACTSTVDVLPRGIYSQPIANSMKIFNQAVSTYCSGDNKEKLSTSTCSEHASGFHHDRKSALNLWQPDRNIKWYAKKQQ